MSLGLSDFFRMKKKEALDADGEMPEDDGERLYSEGRFNFVR